MMKDIYLLITRENSDSLYELADFTWFSEYYETERMMWKGDIGCIRTANFIFHFRYHNNVIIENKPD